MLSNTIILLEMFPEKEINFWKRRGTPSMTVSFLIISQKVGGPEINVLSVAVFFSWQLALYW